MRVPASAVFLVLLSLPAWAHQPVVAARASYPPEAPYEIVDPEISKAIFAELEGEPQYYRIVSETPFRFYAGITTPRIEGCPLVTWFSFDVLDGDFRPIATLDGETFAWWSWYEKFGGKWYWIGPEIGEDFKATEKYPAGTYNIRVHNEENQGKYVLAVGDIESFTLDVIARSLITMPGINERFWDSRACPSVQ